MTSLIPASQLAGNEIVAVVSFGVALVYLYVGFRLYQRPVSPQSKLAATQLALWWGGIGVTTVLGGAEVALAAGGGLTLPLAKTLYLLLILIDCVLLWGLVGYLTYVYTGKYHLVPLSAFYAWFYFTVLYYFFSQRPYAVLIAAGNVDFLYAAKPTPVLEAVLLLGLLGPELVGAILYLSLLRRTADPAQRYRITLVGGGILGWFLIDLLIPSSTIEWMTVKTILAVIPGVMSLVAYFPPEWARRRYGVTSVSAAGSAGPGANPEP
jgi:hypothetical protein